MPLPARYMQLAGFGSVQTPSIAPTMPAQTAGGWQLGMLLRPGLHGVPSATAATQVPRNVPSVVTHRPPAAHDPCTRLTHGSPAAANVCTEQMLCMSQESACV